MIYLFNSAYRITYLKNVLNILSLPDNYINFVRYRFKDRIQIHDSVLDNIDMLKGQTIVFIFVDRFSESIVNDKPEKKYKFYPIRFGEYTTSAEENDQLQIYFKVKKFISVNDIDDFNDNLIKKLQDYNLLKLTNNDPKETNDGNYAIYIPNDNGTELGLNEAVNQDDAWDKITNQLKNTKVFHSSKEVFDEDEIIFPLFTKFRIKKIQDGREILANVNYSDNKDSNIELISKENYRLYLTYFNPFSRKTEINLVTDSIINHDFSKLKIESEKDTIYTPLRIETDGDVLNSKFAFFSENSYIFDKVVNLLIKSSMRNTIFFFTALFLYILVTALLGLDTKDFKPDEFIYNLTNPLIRIFLGILSGLSIYTMFKLKGKNIF